MGNQRSRAARGLFFGLFISLNCIFISAAAEQDFGPGFGNLPAGMMMEGVNSGMLNASYWTNYPGGSTLLMSREQIKKFNDSNFADPDCNMHILPDMNESFDGVKLRKDLASFSDPKGLFLNGEPVPASFYAAIRAQIANAPVSSAMNVGYGFCVKRCVLRSLPCGEPLADDVTDPEWDNLANAAVLFNDPVVAYFTTADGRFVYVKNECCNGWAPADSIVLCHNKQEWLSAAYPERFLIVTGDKIQTEKSYVPGHSGLTLEMGVKLEICDQGQQVVDNRMNWYNYVVYVPGRGADGLYEKQEMLIPKGSDVHMGYLPLTQKNLIGQAYKSLGTRYGWGGSENAQDCSSFIRDVYSCFGLTLPRNTTWQSKMHSRKIPLSDLTAAEKKRVLDSLPAGSILEFPGHEMLYLGTENGKYFTINDVSSLYLDTETGAKKYRVRDIVINSMEDTKRANGHTWLDQLSIAIIPFQPENNPETD